jgi:hypothetical protein
MVFSPFVPDRAPPQLKPLAKLLSFTVAMARWNRTAKWKRARIAALIARDGPGCWLCTLPISRAATRKGQRASLEHLLARCLGGSDALDNLVLCHDACNRHLGERPVEKKREMREKWHRTAERRRAERARA